MRSAWFADLSIIYILLNKIYNKSFLVFKLFYIEEQKGEINPDQVSLVKAAQEVDIFFNHSIIEKKEDVFNYWKHGKKFPLLKELALKLLAPPASSIFSERLFSEYGNIYEKKRSRLLPQRGEMLLFIHHNGNKFLNE